MEAAKKVPSRSNAFTDLEEMLRSMATRIVDKPEELLILPATGTDFVHFEVRCADSDLGALLGRRGTHADAMRLLLSAAATARKVRVTLQCISLEGEGHAGR